MATREELEDKLCEKCNFPRHCDINAEYYEQDFGVFVQCRPQDLPDKARIRAKVGLAVVSLDTIAMDFDFYFDWRSSFTLELLGSV